MILKSFLKPIINQVIFLFKNSVNYMFCFHFLFSAKKIEKHKAVICFSLSIENCYCDFKSVQNFPKVRCISYMNYFQITTLFTN